MNISIQNCDKKIPGFFKNLILFHSIIYNKEEKKVSFF